MISLDTFKITSINLNITETVKLFWKWKAFLLFAGDLSSLRLEQEWDFMRPLGLSLPGAISFLVGRGVNVDFKMYFELTFLSSTFFFRRQIVLTNANSTKLPKINPVQPMNQISDALM